MAGVALGDIHLDFTWQAWHNLTSTVVLHGRCRDHGTGWRAWAHLVARDAAALCVASVALGDIHLCFTWQAWQNLTSTVVLRGRRGTHGTGWRAWARDAAPLCVAGVALGDIHLGFAWQAWRNLTSTFVLRGRRGTHGTGWRAWARLVARDAAALCVAGVALGDIHFGSTWQAWHNLTSTVVLRWQALGDIHFGSAWQAWHNLTATVVLRGRRGTISHPRSFCMAGVALMALGGALGPAWSRMTPRHFAWQAWHLVTSTLVSRGMRGTISHPRSFCVAGMALIALGGALGPAWSRVTPRHFAWQAWHLVTSSLVSRGRGGAISHPPSFCVAGVALMALGGALGPAWSRVTPRHFAWQAWHLVTSTLVSLVPHGRRGAISHPRSFCVAGVAQSHIHVRFAWQAWHSWPWVARLGPLWSRVTPRHFAWQAWHLVTSTIIYFRFTWQAWHNLTYVTSTLVSQTISHTSLSHACQSHTIFHTDFAHTPSVIQSLSTIL